MLRAQRALAQSLASGGLGGVGGGGEEVDQLFGEIRAAPVNQTKLHLLVLSNLGIPLLKETTSWMFFLGVFPCLIPCISRTDHKNLPKRRAFFRPRSLEAGCFPSPRPGLVPGVESRRNSRDRDWFTFGTVWSFPRGSQFISGPQTARF